MSSAAIDRQSSYQKPYFIPELNEEGLSQYDIAAALGITPHHVVEKLRRTNKSSWESHGWNIHVSTCKSGKAGRPKVMWHLNTAAAKVFVARWENNRGDGYLAFLLTCERVALEELPKLLEMVKALARENNALIQENGELRAKLGGASKQQRELPPKNSTTLVPINYVVQLSMFGEPLRTPVFARVDKSTLTPAAQRDAQICHMTRVAAGLTKKARQLQEDGMLERLAFGDPARGVGRSDH